jgi:hypothetical protein
VDSHIFHLMYLAWLQCGHDTRPVNEEYERMVRQRPDAPRPGVCVHGKTPLTCEQCYLRGNGYLKGNEDGA